MSRLDHGLQDCHTGGLGAGAEIHRHERGLSREYLQNLRQLVTMIERSPAEPELHASILAWRPRSYQDFSAPSDSRDAASALREYAAIDPIMRRSFEAIAAALDKLAADAVLVLAQPSVEAARDLETPLCTMRMLLDRAATLVEDGDTLAAEAAGRRANRLYAR